MSLILRTLPPGVLRRVACVLRASRCQIPPFARLIAGLSNWQLEARTHAKHLQAPPVSILISDEASELLSCFAVSQGPLECSVCLVTGFGVEDGQAVYMHA